jgi:cytochrome c-type protein NapC
LLLIGIAIALALLLIFRPSLAQARSGKILAFVVLFLLPASLAVMGASEHLERSKQTRFCLSCHIMESYGRSLYVDAPNYIPASHFQNARIPRDQACYTCHSDYVMYGDIRAKIRGLRHVYVQYFKTPQMPIRLYNPYNNRECLHCHEGARSFEEGVVHNSDPSVMAAIESNQISCVSSGCHDMVHNVPHLDELKYWKEAR